MERDIHFRLEDTLLERFMWAIKKDVTVDNKRSAVLRKLVREYVDRIEKDYRD